jgi:putative membrane-bound dehydrogenase-like protein
MRRLVFPLLSGCCWTLLIVGELAAQATLLTASMSAAGDQVLVHRQGRADAVVTHVVLSDFRPYLHPIAAPDGAGVLTEFSPGHHKHQTGLYWGFTRVNGRDYFHHPEGSHWKRVSARIVTAESGPSQDDADGGVAWQTVYELLDESGSPVLRESQLWTMRELSGQWLLDLEWTGQALVDVTIGQYDYGGLFLRMPYQPGIHGRVVNSARQEGPRAEGQRAVWLDVGMQVPGRDDLAHIAIFDHPQNKGFPQPWRVDGQLGVGPVRARLGDWRIDKGNQETIRHRMVVFTGELDDVALTDAWSQYSGQGMTWAEWQLAQQEGRLAEFLSAQQAVEKFTLQDGFAANVYASEPMITQPMAFCWDAKGRLWIAENRDYETRQSGFAGDGHSRILILEDADGDGVAERRSVFLEGIPFPAAIAVGMGGLWLGAPPNLLFIPDADGDDKADMHKIEVRLTGWGIRDRHETLNSLLWGPDGWLYGCQGFATPSRVGKPAGQGKLYRHNDPFPAEIELQGPAVDIDGGVWRYHPSKDRFEVVAHGFSNPWGIDYNAHGQLFITACVIPHLWHVIPGGIYHRQGGSHFNPYVYSDIRTIADHRHRSAHGGARIYLSDAFPAQYQHRIFMANIHEHAVLTDILEPKGSGFVGRHGDDFLLAGNAQWIGFSMEIGRDGSVYVLDWHDADICGKEVLHKETGRVFRISASQSLAKDFPGRYQDLNTLDDLALARMQAVPSVWHARQSRVILQHRAQQREIDAGAIAMLRGQFASGRTIAERLQAMWTLHITGQLSPHELIDSLGDADEQMRGWAVRLLCEDFQPPAGAGERLAAMAQADPSAVVRLSLASVAQRLDDELSWPILLGLSQREEDNDDHNLPKMIWFALEPLVVKQPERALELAAASKIGLLTRHVARRLADEERFDKLFAALAGQGSQPRLELLLGIRDALEGRFDMQSPDGWAELYPLLRSAGGETAQLALQLSQQFGDSVAAAAMLATLQDTAASVEDRRQSLQGLAGRKRAELKAQLAKLLGDEDLRRDAIRAVASFDDVQLAKALLDAYPDLGEADRQEVVHALASRSSYGAELTEAIRRGAVPRGDVPAYVARLLGRVVGPRFVDVWGPIEALGVDQEAAFARYRALLTADSLSKADPSRGRVLFDRTCAACHKLYGRGGNVGPDITGANRNNLEYLLGNILMPSAEIQEAYRMHIVLTDDGRIYSGIPAEENDRQLRLRIADRDEPVTIALSQIESREIAAVSMMPEGTLTNLQDGEVLDLFAYLQTLVQVPIPETE